MPLERCWGCSIIEAWVCEVSLNIEQPERDTLWRYAESQMVKPAAPAGWQEGRVWTP